MARTCDLSGCVTRNQLTGAYGNANAANFGGRSPQQSQGGGPGVKFPRTAYPRKLVRK
jgi:hypothetical protein